MNNMQPQDVNINTNTGDTNPPDNTNNVQFQIEKPNMDALGLNNMEGLVPLLYDPKDANYIPDNFNDIQDVLSKAPANSNIKQSDIIAGVIQKKTKEEQRKLSPFEKKLTHISDDIYDSVFLDTKRRRETNLDLSGYEVGIDEMYKRLNSVDYIKRYDSYLPTMDNADYFGKRQSTLEKWENGLGKFIGKTLVNVADATVGTVYGVINGISKGSFSAVYNNDFSKYIDDLNTTMDYELPNYVTAVERNQSFLKRMVSSANFWADDVLSGLSFTAGAIISEGIWAGVTGGASLVTIGGRMALKTAGEDVLKGLAKSELKGASKNFLKRNGLKIFKAYNRTIPKSVAGEVFNNVRFLYTSAGFEAGVEARLALNQSIDDFKNSYKRVLGRAPSDLELGKFMEDAVRSSNVVFASNVALVGSSNIIQFGSYFGVGTGLSKKLSQVVGKKLLGTGIEKTLTEGGEVIYKSLKPKAYQKVIGNLWNVLEAPIAEGVIEEGGQGVISQTSKNWLASKYNPGAFKENYDLMQAIHDGFAYSYGSKEGFDQVGIGMIIGVLGAAGKRSEFTGARTPFNIGEYGQQVKYNNEIAEALNKTTGKLTQAHLNMIDRLVGTNQFRHWLAKSQDSYKNGDFGKATTEFDVAQFSKMMLEHKAGLLDDSVDDFKHYLDRMNDNSIKEMYNLNDDEVSQYKEQLVNEYKNNVEIFKKARKVAESVNPEINHNSDFENELALNIYLGVKSEKRAGEIADEIADMVGTKGVSSALRLYSNISKKAKRRLKAIDDISQDIKQLEDEYATLTQSFTASDTKVEDRRKDNKDTGKNIDKLKDKQEKLIARLEQKRSEYEELKSKLNDRFFYRNFAFNGSIYSNDDTTISDDDLLGSIEELKKLDNYLSDLQEENPKMAKYLSSLINEYQDNVNNFREYNIVFEQMSNTKFANNYKGVLGILKDKVGITDEEITKNDNPLFQQQFKSIEELIESKKGELTEEQAFTLRVLNRLATSFQINQKGYELIGENNEPIDNAIYEKWKKDGVVPDEVKNNIVEKVSTFGSNADLSVREKEIYNAHRNEFQKDIEDIKFNKGSSFSNIFRKKNRVKMNKSIPNIIERLEDFVRQAKERNAYLKDLDSDKFDKKDIPTGKDYKEFEKLSKEKMEGKLTPYKLNKYNKLKEKINKWGQLEGAISGHINLADVIEQLIYLHDNIDNSGGKEILDVLGATDDLVDIPDFKPTDRNKNFDHIQSYDKAMVTKNRSNGNYAISNINLNGFLNNLLRAGYNINVKNSKGRKIKLNKNNEYSIKNIKKGQKYVVELENGEKFNIVIGNGNNLELSNKDRQVVNENTPYKIFPSNDLPTNYNPLLFETRIGDDIFLIPVDTNFVIENGKVGVDNIAIQKLKGGDNIYLEVDTNNEYNKKLLKDYHNTKNEKQKAEALHKLQNELVITLKDKQNNLIGVHKSTLNKPVKANDENYAKLQEIRLYAVKKVLDENYLEGQVIDLALTVPVSHVYVGHPNFVIKKEGDKYKIINNEFKDSDLKRVKTIGYIYNGELTLKDKVDKYNEYPFATNFMRKEKYKNKIVPVVVFDFMGKNYVYPITLNSSIVDKSGKVFDVIENDRLTRQQKILKINDIIKYNGLDLAEFGITFDTFNNKNINRIAKELSQTKETADIVGEVEGKENTDINSWLKSNAKININISSNPFHSPKVVTKLNEVSPLRIGGEIIETADFYNIDNIPDEIKSELNNTINNNKCS